MNFDQVKLPAIHPGEILVDELNAINVTVPKLARAIDVPPSRMTEIIKGHRSISADTALRLAQYFGMSARFWLNLQAAYDLATVEAEKGEQIAAVVRPYAG